MPYKDIHWDWFGIQFIMTAKERKKAHYVANKEAHKEQQSTYDKAYYQANREKILARKKEKRKSKTSQDTFH
jgi:hypothetical protein